MSIGQKNFTIYVLGWCVTVGVFEQAKSLSRETFRVKTVPFSSQAEPGQVSITLMVAGRDKDSAA